MPGSADETGAAGCRPVLFSIARGMTGSVGDAGDVVEDAFPGLTQARQAGTTITEGVPDDGRDTAGNQLPAFGAGGDVPVGLAARAGGRPHGTGRGRPSTPSWATRRRLRSWCCSGLLAGREGGVHAARSVRVPPPGGGEDRRQDGGELPADLRRARRVRRGGRKARNRPQVLRDRRWRRHGRTARRARARGGVPRGRRRQGAGDQRAAARAGAARPAAGRPLPPRPAPGPKRACWVPQPSRAGLSPARKRSDADGFPPSMVHRLLSRGSKCNPGRRMHLRTTHPQTKQPVSGRSPPSD